MLVASKMMRGMFGGLGGGGGGGRALGEEEAMQVYAAALKRVSATKSLGEMLHGQLMPLLAMHPGLAQVEDESNRPLLHYVMAAECLPDKFVSTVITPSPTAPCSTTSWQPSACRTNL